MYLFEGVMLSLNGAKPHASITRADPRGERMYRALARRRWEADFYVCLALPRTIVESLVSGQESGDSRVSRITAMRARDRAPKSVRLAAREAALRAGQQQEPAAQADPTAAPPSPEGSGETTDQESQRIIGSKGDKSAIQAEFEKSGWTKPDHLT